MDVMNLESNKFDEISEYDVAEGERLNDEEREFAAENSNLIYAFLYMKHLSKEEYYDLAAIGYVKAVIVFFRKVKEFKFSTIAFVKMYIEISKYWQNIKAVKRGKGVHPVSLHKSVYGDEDAVFIDYLNTNENYTSQAEVEESIIVNEFIKLLDDKERFVLNMRMNSYNVKDIASKIGISNIETREIISSLRKKAREYYGKKA